VVAAALAAGLAKGLAAVIAALFVAVVAVVLAVDPVPSFFVQAFMLRIALKATIASVDLFSEEVILKFLLVMPSLKEGRTILPNRGV
jgi:hypothetical protein